MIDSGSTPSIKHRALATASSSSALVINETPGPAPQPRNWTITIGTPGPLSGLIGQKAGATLSQWDKPRAPRR